MTRPSDRKVVLLHPLAKCEPADYPMQQPGWILTGTDNAWTLVREDKHGRTVEMRELSASEIEHLAMTLANWMIYRTKVRR